MIERISLTLSSRWRKYDIFALMKRAAFTLIELLVTIAIIGLLSSIAIVSMSGSRDKAAIAAGLQFEASVQHAVGSEVLADWEFDEGSGGTAGDSSGNGKTATLMNSVSWRCAATNINFTPTGQGCAVGFGGGGYVSTPALNIGDGTVSLWFNNKGSNPGAVILGKRNTGCFSSAIYINSSANSNDLRVYNAGPETMIGMTKPSQWNQLVIVRAGAGAEADFYLNGKLALKNAYNLNLPDLISTVGATCAGVNEFTGYIDSVRVYGAALGASRIERLYAEEKLEHDKRGV